MGETHRECLIDSPFPGMWIATSPNYDASYEGEEDGWVYNGERVSASTREGLIGEIDAWIEGHS